MVLMPLTGIVVTVLTADMVMRLIIIKHVKKALTLSVKFLQDKERLDG